MSTCYLLPAAVTAVCSGKMMNDTVRRLWQRFTLDTAQLTMQACDAAVFRIGETALPELAAGDEYAIRIDAQGAAVVGRDHGGLMRGFAVLLMQLEFDGLQPLLKPAFFSQSSTVKAPKQAYSLCSCRSISTQGTAEPLSTTITCSCDKSYFNFAKAPMQPGSHLSLL